MIHAILEDVGEALKAKRCPVDLVDGPEFNLTSYGKDRVVLEAGGGDDFGPVKRAGHENEKVVANRGVGIQVRVFARVDRKGAQVFEHRRKCDHLLDMTICALKRVAVEKGYEMKIRSGDYYVPPDLSASDSLNGCAYQLLILWDHKVEDVDWNYDRTDTYTVGRALMTGAPNVTFDATAITLSRDAGSWIDDGFAVGMKVTVSGTDSNDGQTASEITLATALELTFEAPTTFVDEGPIAGAKISVGLIQTTFESETN